MIPYGKNTQDVSGIFLKMYLHLTRMMLALFYFLISKNRNKRSLLDSRNEYKTTNVENILARKNTYL